MAGILDHYRPQGILGAAAPRGVLGEDYRQPVRPLEGGEYRANPDGSRSTELLVTVQLPDGQWVNIPSLWMANNQMTEIPSPDLNAMIAERYEANTGVRFPRYRSVEEAEMAARNRSASGGALSAPLAVPFPRPRPR